MRSFIIYLNFVSLLAVCLFACNHHSSNPMLQQVDSLLEMKPDSALTILGTVVKFRHYESIGRLSR